MRLKSEHSGDTTLSFTVRLETRKSYPENVHRRTEASKNLPFIAPRLSLFIVYVHDVRDARHVYRCTAFIGHLKIFLGHCPAVFRSR